jgi:hypothetical protein
MQTYIVLYRDQTLLPLDAPLGFRCQADDPDHAEEQCMDAYPDAEILWLVETADVNVALADYWNITY